MSAIVCGKMSSSYFEELQYHSPQPSSSSPSLSVAKRIRSSSSPSRFSPPRLSAVVADSASLHWLLRLEFPDMENEATVLSLLQIWSGIGFIWRVLSESSALCSRLLAIHADFALLEKALHASGDDLDLAIKCLNELRIRSTDADLSPLGSEPLSEGISSNIQLLQEGVINVDDNTATGNLSDTENLLFDGSQWVELLVREMTHASNMDDARNRASKVLELLEKIINSCANAEAARSLHEENLMLNEQVKGLLHGNSILKRAVAIQHERQKESDEKNQEIPHLKQLILEYHERIGALEVNNYALTLHLQQAQQSSSIPGRFHPDVF